MPCEENMCVVDKCLSGKSYSAVGHKFNVDQ